MCMCGICAVAVVCTIDGNLYLSMVILHGTAAVPGHHAVPRPSQGLGAAGWVVLQEEPGSC